MRNLVLSLIACCGATAATCVIPMKLVGYGIGIHSWMEIGFFLLIGTAIGAVGALPVWIVSLKVKFDNRYAAIIFGAVAVGLAGGIGNYCYWISKIIC